MVTRIAPYIVPALTPPGAVSIVRSPYGPSAQPDGRRVPGAAQGRLAPAGEHRGGDGMRGRLAAAARPGAGGARRAREIAERAGSSGRASRQEVLFELATSPSRALAKEAKRELQKLKQRGVQVQSLPPQGEPVLKPLPEGEAPACYGSSIDAYGERAV